MSYLKNKVENVLAKADIRVNGSRPWDIQVHDERLFQRLISAGSLGLGEAYMENWWDADQLDEFSTHIFKAKLWKEASSKFGFLKPMMAKLINRQSIEKSKIVGKVHYDLGNEFYANMLDKRMVYSCADWSNATNLDEAQENKLSSICERMNLKPDMKVLDIGCGWGSFAKYAAQKHQVEVIGITISEEQAIFATKNCQGLPVTILIKDYRDMKNYNNYFDRMISIGMFEHVGFKNYRNYMLTTANLLTPNGMAFLHTIGNNSSSIINDPWLDKYIFPNSLIPSLSMISSSMEDIFIVEELRNIGPNYDPTLMAWFNNFDNAWSKMNKNYSESFYRMWKFYLLMCAGSFRARINQVWQLVLSKDI